MAKDTFLEAVAVISAEDEDLRRAMKDNETVVKTSVNKMQGDLNRLNKTVGTTGTQAASTGQVFGAFGAQMSAVGGTAGMVGGKIAGLGSAFTGLGSAIFGLPGVILLATAALGIIISKVMSAKEETRKWKEELIVLQKAGVEQFAGMVNAAGKAQRAALLMKAELRGPQDLLLEQTRQTRTLLLERMADIRRRQELLPAAAGGETRQLQREWEALASQRVSLRQSTLSKIAAMEEAQRAKEQLAEKTHLQEMDTLRRQRQAAFALTPIGRVQMALQKILSEAAAKTQMEKAIRAIEQAMPGGAAYGEALRGMLGLTPALAPAVAAEGDMARGGGISPFAFAGGIPQAGGGRDRTDHRIRLEEKRTKDIERVADATERLERKQESGGAL